MQSRTVCAIIAARNAEATIGAAVRSALRAPEVAEVVVVDDASTDATAEVARRCDDGSNRLRIISLTVNRGPSHARNRAIEESNAPFIAILDADDAFLPGRFANLFDATGWDFVADNIVVIEEGRISDPATATVPAFAPEPQTLALADFVSGNIGRRSAHRAEMGFLKPMMSRAFLDRHALRYDEGMRLGEDYELYVRAMARGARFVTIRCCGYCAIQRAGSLSGHHSTADLRALADADLAVLAQERVTPAERKALIRHERHVRGKYHVRQFLDVKARDGLRAALAYAAADPARFAQIASEIAAIKGMNAVQAISGPPSARSAPAVRFLMPGRPAGAEP